MKRCINIDWLEVYCHELDDGEIRDAEWFRAHGFSVVERPFGTRVYEQMFTLLDTEGNGLLEVRRQPKGLATTTGFSVLDAGSCHLRLCNRTCYYREAARIMIEFTQRYGFIISRISRIDICMDFAKFDTGDDPQKFLGRFLKGKYSKINQANISAHGKDQWDGRAWNSLSWGSLKSMVTTKLYNKTMELRQKKDKPYIRQAWLASGLIDDWQTCIKHKADGTTYQPDIWRLEFSISSSVKRWYVIEDCSGKKKRLRSVHSVLDDYITPQQLMQHFQGLVNHYFCFKLFKPGIRKDRCPDKPLFRFDAKSTYYEVEHIAAANPKTRDIETLARRLSEYISIHENTEAGRAAASLLALLKQQIARQHAGSLEALSEIRLLQQLIAMRIKGTSGESLEHDTNLIKKLIQIEGELF